MILRILSPSVILASKELIHYYKVIYPSTALAEELVILI